MQSTPLQLTPDEQQRSLSNLKLERDAIVLYDRLAEIERDPRRADAFRRIAANERRHAEIWANRLEEAGVEVPPVDRPRARVLFIIQLARILGTRRVADLVRALEGDEEEMYADQLTPETAAIAADEREHAAIWDRLENGEEPAVRSSGDGAVGMAAGAGAMIGDGTGATAGAVPAPVSEAAARTAGQPAHADVRQEAWHRGGQSGTLRAAVFGVNDGLVSNLSLVMGVAGAVTDNQFIVLAGVAGLLAGAFSMAAGEYISMQSQRELFERQIAIEREEMRVMPEEEERELAQIYRAKGLPAEDAARVAAALMQDPSRALDTKVREELGLDPDELGSPWGAAGSSFAAFCVGAIVPLVPFLLGTGLPALLAALAASFMALFIVGALVSIVTGRGLMFSALRQVAIGAIAAAVTYGVGTLIGVTVS